MDLDLERVPRLENCAPGIRPLEFLCVVALMEAAEKIGSLYVPDEFRDKQEMALQVGRLIAVSPVAFTYAEIPLSEVPKVGDLVMIVRYGGGNFTGQDGKTYRMVKDSAIMGVIESPKLPYEAPELTPLGSADMAVDVNDKRPISSLTSHVATQHHFLPGQPLPPQAELEPAMRDE